MKQERLKRGGLFRELKIELPKQSIAEKIKIDKHNLSNIAIFSMICDKKCYFYAK